MHASFTARIPPCPLLALRLCFWVLGLLSYLTASAENSLQTVTLKDGRQLEGTVKKTADQEITLTARVAGGAIEYPFTFEQIESVQFHDEAIFLEIDTHLANGEKALARKRLDARYRAKAQYFALLPSEQIMQFYPLIELHLDFGDPYAAIGVGTNLQPFVRDPEQSQILSDTLLMAHYHLPLKEKASALADKRLRTSPRYGVSALPWYIKGQLAFDQEDYKQALIFALDPIVFSSQFPMNYLEHCYALAIAAHSKLGEGEAVHTLAQEMQNRGLKWPNVEALTRFKTLSLAN